MTDPKSANPDAKAAADKAAADKAAADRNMANVAARNAGFVDAEAQAAALAASSRSVKVKKKAAQPKPLIAKVAEKGMDEARALLPDDVLEIGFGDNNRLNVDIAKIAAPMLANGAKLNNKDLIALRTEKLHRTTTVTYAYLLHGNRVLAARELGCPIRVEPGLQITFKPGTLSFS